MDTVDLKGIAWVGNIYQKFEAMCLEVEEAMCQETAKYVENQVQTVGASMKRFCSDVMQDMLPPSSKDPTKVASADLLLNPYLEFGIYKRPISNIKEDAKDPVCIKDSSKDSKSVNEGWDDWSAASFNWEISDNDEANCDRMARKASNEAIECESREKLEATICNKILDTSIASPASGMTLLTKHSAKKGKRSRDIYSRKTITAEVMDIRGNTGPVFQIGSQASSNTPSGRSDMCGNRGPVSQICSQASSNTQRGLSPDGDASHTDSCGNSGLVSPQISSHVSADIPSDQCADGELFQSRTGGSVDSDLDITDEDDATQRMGSTGQECESEFEETCVLVDENDLCPINSQEERSRSYKKKIRGAFSLKKKSARKQEYKQLAARYGNINSESTIKGHDAIVHVLPKNTDKLRTHELLESEWELL